jgi:hypothetical protein
MSIKVPAQEHGYTYERRRTAKERKFGKAIGAGFRAQAQERRERQEALGIPARAPLDGKSPAATEVERIGQGARPAQRADGRAVPTHDYLITRADLSLAHARRAAARAQEAARKRAARLMMACRARRRRVEPTGCFQSGWRRLRAGRSACRRFRVCPRLPLARWRGS